MTPAALVGHEAQRELLQQLGAHTLLFTGPAGVGRRQVARWYAALLNCQGRRADDPEPCAACQSCQLFAAETHPDYREVSPRAQTSSGKRSRRPEIRIAQLVPRAGEDPADPPLSRWLETRPQFRRRVGVIDDAHTLTVGAANAFLKMLEEPPSRALIILIAPSAQAVLPTIASRAAPVRFGTLPEQSASAHPAARLGRLGDTRILEAHPETFTDIHSVITDYVSALPKGLEAAFEAADALEKSWLAESPFDLSDLLLAQFSAWSPAHYRAASEILSDFEAALAAYAAPSLAVQVMTLELRKALSR